MLFTKAQDEREDDAAKTETNKLFEELLRHIFEKNKLEQFLYIGDQIEGEEEHDNVKLSDEISGEKIPYITTE